MYYITIVVKYTKKNNLLIVPIMYIFICGHKMESSNIICATYFVIVDYKNTGKCIIIIT